MSKSFLQKLFAIHSSSFASRGQVMLVTVLILGGIIIGTTAIAGYITTLRIKQAGSAAYSAKAIFAADAGLERAFYHCFKLGEASPGCGNIGVTSLGNGSSYSVVYFEDGLGGGEIRSTGLSSQSARALRFRF